MTAATPERAEPRTMRIELSLRSVFAIFAIVAGLWLLARLWEIVLVCVIGLVLAGSFSPVVESASSSSPSSARSSASASW
jgi:di/tricarboxylate transporter